MARQATGQVVVRERARGRVYGLRFRANGERQYLTLGTDAEGWDQRRADEALRDELAKVRAGVWRPARPEPVAPLPDDPTFREFASEWFATHRNEIRPNTASSYYNDLTNHLLPHFAEYRLSQITIPEVDRYRSAKVREGVLKPRSINMHLALLAQILEVAVEYELIPRNPASGRRRRLKAARPAPVHLDTAEHIAVLLEAATILDGESYSTGGRHTTGRRAALAAMLFAGLRAEEVGALRWRDVDLANGRLHIGRSKTSAGVREVELLPILRDDLLALKAAAGSMRQDAHVFVTSTGESRDRHNLRQRVVAPIVKRANELLAERDARPLPAGLSPHKLRHTFASLLVALGNDPAHVMSQLGHTDPAFTLRVYTHIMRRDDGERARLRALVEGGSLAAPEGASDPLPVS